MMKNFNCVKFILLFIAFGFGCERELPRTANKSAEINSGLRIVIDFEKGKYGIEDSLGKNIFPFKLTFVLGESEGRVVFLLDSEIQAIDNKGRICVLNNINGMSCFSEGVAPARSKGNGKWGYVDYNGSFVIKPEYEKTFMFSCGRGRVLIDGKYGYIDIEGELAIESKYWFARDFSEGLAAVGNNGIEYIDLNGKSKINIKKSSSIAGPFLFGLARLKSEIDKEVWYIDKKGETKIVIENCNFEDNRFGDVDSDEYFPRNRVEVSRFIFNDNSEMSNCNSSGYGFHEGLSKFVKDSKVGFIDLNGRIAIEPIYKNATSFSEGYAAAQKENGWGYIDSQGNVRVPFNYDSASKVNGKRSVVYKDDKGEYLYFP